ncbi:SRPBCC family protein [Gordonia zhaorongruii]|uniref:SRPBCC family protein n=1 Tax=Gordonia zhaorongruii TaxID=2597659 RepID=UPI0022A7328D|nr:SRPBCC family protein [Gordonia zhaorongruii]
MRASVTIDAPASRVWEVLTDFRNLVRASPELMSMTPLRPGGLRVGQVYASLNRRNLVVWATRNRIIRVDRERALAWDTVTSGARWIFELDGAAGTTVLTERRSVPDGLTMTGRLFASTMLGGGENHAAELETAIDRTLRVIKAKAESA